jgi:hypothetical protein
MLTSIAEINIRIVVRRVSVGATPFGWAVYNGITPRYASPDRFRSLEAAYSAGQARLAEFLPPKNVKRKQPLIFQPSVPAVMDDHDWQLDVDDPDETDPSGYDAPEISPSDQGSCSHSVDVDQLVS